ncbi:MAG: TIGR04282 family arsenosugar biosynthesis glycosyltransferase [Reichenbachiella sp.]|uniref:TIGR04282 family arsenosugar biosynthesis glycosyltransferase n=1 Tax=Reichenbachiella sp. TaxID=2184521 RepID=UPI00326320D8
MSDHALIIFVKNPELGKVKTRLAKNVGDDEALRIYKKLLDFTQKESSKANADSKVYYSSEITKKDIWVNAQKKKQHSGDLGAKMAAAFQEELVAYRKVCIIGTDCAELTSEVIDQAFNALDSKDFVLGPANDGGYYLLGMKDHHPQLFEDVEWSTSAVLNQTIEKIKLMNADYVLLPELIDVDTLKDWELVMENFK